MSGPEDQDIERAWAEIVANWDQVATKPSRSVDTDPAQQREISAAPEQQKPPEDGDPSAGRAPGTGEVDLHGVELRAEAERRARLRREPVRGDVGDSGDTSDYSDVGSYEVGSYEDRADRGRRAGDEEVRGDDTLWTEGAPIQDRGAGSGARRTRPSGAPGETEPHEPDRDEPPELGDETGDRRQARRPPQRPRSSGDSGQPQAHGDEAARGSGSTLPAGTKTPWARTARWPWRLVKGLRRHERGPAGGHHAGERPADDDRRAADDGTWERLLDEHFVPQEPPPLPRGTLVGRLAWAGVLLGPVLLLLFVVFWRSAPTAIIALPAMAVLAGFLTLVARLPGRRDDDDRGDGAVV